MGDGGGFPLAPEIRAKNRKNRKELVENSLTGFFRDRWRLVSFALTEKAMLAHSSDASFELFVVELKREKSSNRRPQTQKGTYLEAIDVRRFVQGVDDDSLVRDSIRNDALSQIDLAPYFVSFHLKKRRQ